MEVTQVLVERLLQRLYTEEVTIPDDFSQHLLKHCVHELAAPLKTVFSVCLQENYRHWREKRLI